MNVIIYPLYDDRRTGKTENGLGKGRRHFLRFTFPSLSLSLSRSLCITIALARSRSPFLSFPPSFFLVSNVRAHARGREARAWISLRLSLRSSMVGTLAETCTVDGGYGDE